MEQLLTFRIENLICFFLFPVVFSLVIRTLIVMVEVWGKGSEWAFPILLGYGMKVGDQREGADYGLGFFIGYFEILGYSMLMATGMIEVIGFWLVFKTANRWNYQTLNRGRFSRYLFANMLVLIFSFMMARGCLLN